MPDQPRPDNPARTIRVEDELWQAFGDACKEDGEKVSVVTRRLIRKHLAQRARRKN